MRVSICLSVFVFSIFELVSELLICLISDQSRVICEVPLRCQRGMNKHHTEVILGI